jgi:hypothetical protein
MKETRHLIPNAHFNFTENLLFAHSQARSNAPAIIVTSEPPKGSKSIKDTHLSTFTALIR